MVSPFYDSLIIQVILEGSDRNVRQSCELLGDVVIEGINTNIASLNAFAR